MKSKKFLFNYMDSFSPVGEESEGQKVWTDYIAPFVDDVQIDPYGTAYCLIKSESENPLTVVLEAHADEICWMVNMIDPDGMLRVKRNGGSDNMIAASKTVVVRTHDGKYHRGVFGSPAVHTRENYTVKGPEQHELWVDLGLNRKEVDALGIEVGNMVIFDDKFSQIGNYWTGKSLDNKIGGYIIAEVARKLKKGNIKLPYNLYIVNSVQEEVGLHGAKMIAQRLKPDLALVHDVCHNTGTPGIVNTKEGNHKGGEGPVLEYSPQNHRKVIKKIKSVASANNITTQASIGSFGNDTMGFFLANGGTPTAIISTALKYMHTCVEMAHVTDVENVTKLFLETLKSIDAAFINDLHNR